MIIFIYWVQPVHSQENNEQFILVLVPDLSFEEIKWLLDNGYEQALWKTGSLAGVNVRPDGPYSYLNNTVSLSSGNRGLGIQEWNAFEKGELSQNQAVEELLLQLNGRFPQDDLIHPFIHKLQEKNQETTYRAQVGILGQLLKEYKIERFVFGHSDGAEELVRYGSLFTMDKLGDTLGQLKGMTKPNPMASFGIEMAGEKIVNELQSIKAIYPQSFVVIEWGDIFRLFAQKNKMDPIHFNTRYENTLQAFEEFMFQLTETSSADTVMLLSPMMHADAYKDNSRLAPLWIWDRNNRKQKIITSDTTRQDHIVSNLDIAPYILKHFKIPIPQEMIGNTIHLESNKDVQHGQIVAHMDWLFKIFATRSVVLSSYITLLVLLLITVSILLWRNRASNRLRMIVKILLISAVSSPFWLLITAKLLAVVNVGVYFWIMTVFSFITGYLIVHFFKYPLVIVGLMHFAIISIDLLLGSPFMQRSYLGYDPIIGARYYGIGNEYAGVFIVSGIFLVLPFLASQRWKQTISILVLTSTLVYLLGASHLGTNAGSTLAAGITGGFLLYQTNVKRRSLQFFLLILVLIVITLVAILFLLQLVGSPTHIGHGFERLLAGDVGYIVETIKRKLAMNWKIFKFSNWTQLFVTTYVLIGVVLWRQKKLVTSNTHRRILQSGIVASVARLLLNDSGVVAAATSMFLIVTASLYWILEDMKVE